MDYSVINPDGFAAVVNYGYHCATAYSEGSGKSLQRFAGMCRERGADLWLGAFKSSECEMYATQIELDRLGVKKFYDMSPEAAYVKAVLAYNLPDTDPSAFMRSCLYFEILNRENEESW